MIHIKQDGTGDFTSVQAALDSLPADNQEPVTLFIHKGIYREQIHVTVPYVSFTGESAEETILTYGLYARMPSDDIGKLGTFRTYSCFIDTHDFTASNLTFENSAGPGAGSLRRRRPDRIPRLPFFRKPGYPVHSASAAKRDRA